MEDAAPQIPLKQPVLHILLALARGELHGLGIADEVAASSDGAVRLGPGTLYRSLDEMRASALIERVPAPVDGSDPRRKYYGITGNGRGILQAEMERLRRLVDRAEAHDVFPAKA